MPHSEFDLIERIRRRQTVRSGVETGIGDDAAVLNHDQRTRQTIATDMLLEGVHFLLDDTAQSIRSSTSHSCPTATPEQVGRKALAVNLSDLAAMGAQPRSAYVSLGIRRDLATTTIDRVWQGLQDLADQFEVTIAGGDTNTWNGPLIISVTLEGSPWTDRAILRSDAQAGHRLLVTGSLGGSLHGHHLDFTPRIQAARDLVTRYPVGAMIDISDGLAADLHHLARASQVGAVVVADQIPISTAARNQLGSLTPLEHALSDGEDFELLFTLAEPLAAQVSSEGLAGCAVTVIGHTDESRRCQLETAAGQLQPLEPTGWKHT